LGKAKTHRGLLRHFSGLVGAITCLACIDLRKSRFLHRAIRESGVVCSKSCCLSQGTFLDCGLRLDCGRNGPEVIRREPENRGGRTGKPARPERAAQRQESKGQMMITMFTGAGRRTRSMMIAGVSLLALAACDENGQMALFQGQGASEQGGSTANRSVRLVERDVEAPQVFQVTEAGLWDGRPSLGGVWVAHPDVAEPERVIIRNTANGNFVIGALFRREVDVPGPRVQVSSDAAATLGMLAGQPVQVNVTALRREEVADADAIAGDDAGNDPAGADTLPAPSDVSESRLDPIASAAAAIDAAPQTRPPAASAPAATAAAPSPAPAAAAPARASALDKPFLQIGIFSVEANANRAATAMRNAGMVPEIKSQTSQGKPFWRVLVGPASSAAERSSLLDKIKQEGFTDAYAVRN
jgi:rare lipoprotein A